MRETLGSENVHVTPGAESSLSDVLSLRTRRSRFSDKIVELATGRFSQGDCIICHTPRPIFESGIGQNPIRRHHGLE